MTAIEERSAIGVARPRPDAPPKVRGAVRYGADRPVRGLLHARPVLGIQAHARVVAIHTAAALAVPGVIAVLVADDLPIATDAADRVGRPLARGEVVFAGQPVALVVARTEAAAVDAAELVEVELEPLPVVLDPEAALAPDAPLARRDLAGASGDATSMDAQTHAAVGGAGDASIESEVLSENVVSRHRYREGDVAALLERAAHVVAGRFTTPWMYQGYLEPQVCTVFLDEDGTLVVETATQSIFGVRADLSAALGLPHHRIRVVATPLGGAVGGKWSIFESLVGAAVLRLRRPIRLVLQRREDFLATNPGQAFAIDLRVGCDADGRFVGLESRIVADGGAFADSSAESLAGVLIAGPYRWPAFDVKAYGVRTNRFGVGPYRGPSGPPTAFALESLIDELAVRTTIDPIELRRRNAPVEGEPMVDGEAWPPIAFDEVLDALATAPTWLGRDEVPDGEGVGLALGYWPGSKDAAAAICRVSPDGSVQIITGAVDMSGVAGGFQAIAAEVLGIRADAVAVVSLDSGSAPPSPGSGGSTVTYSVGRAIRQAAEDARHQLLDAASLQLEISTDDLELVDGQVRPRGAPERAIRIGKVIRANARNGGAPVEGHATTRHVSLAPSVAAHVVQVRVDRETGHVDVLRHHVVQDVGRALNPALVTGQQQGAALQVVGWALREAMVHDTDGQLRTTTFLDYALPNVGDAGAFEHTIVEVPSADGPFGAKGIGEAPVVAGPAAIANAIAAATGIRLRDLPMTAPRVWAAIEEQAHVR